MSLFEKLVESDSKYSNELLNILRMNMTEGPDTFADLLSSFVNFPLEEKQLLLETVNPIERIELLVDWIQRDLGKATVDRELQRQIQTSIDRRERENYLREQLRVIQDELGDTNAAEREADTYRDRIEDAADRRGPQAAAAARSEPPRRSSRRRRPTTPSSRAISTPSSRCRGPRRPRTSSTWRRRRRSSTSAITASRR